MIKKIKKENAIEFLVIFGITLLICQNFLQKHFSSDTYVLYDLTYMKYPEKYFLLDGRLVSTVICYLAGILNIPIDIYILGMNFMGIIFISIAIYMFYKLLENIINPQENIVKILLICACFILILNQFTLEYLLFPESAVMCLGVLLNVIATKIFVQDTKYKYFKMFLILLTAGICYQGVLNMFAIFAMLAYIVKHIVDKREYKIKLKEFFMDLIKAAIILVTVLLICMIIVKIGTTLLNSKQDRRMHLINFEAVLLRGRTVLEYMDELWNNSMHMLPTHFSSTMLMISLISLILLKPKKEIIIEFILLLLVTFAICVVPMFIFNTGICGRVNVPLMMIWGSSLIILLTQANMKESIKFKRYIYTFIILSFVVNNIYIMQNITEHIASNKVEENMGKTIKYALEKYEKETGNTVIKFAYCYDLEPQQYAVGIKPIGSLTERKLACSWSILQTVNYYCERDFQRTYITAKIYEEYVRGKDYKEFSEDQLIFEGDTLYMVVY